MISARGAVVVAVGVLLWIAARVVGSQDLHIVAVGVTILPLIAWVFVRLNRHNLEMTRRLSATKVPLGQRVTVDLEVENHSGVATSFLLLEDLLPVSLGRPARIVLTGIPARTSQRVTYSLTCRNRGRFHIGPVSIAASDPFALTRVRVDFRHRDELVVFPEIERLGSGLPSPFGIGAGTSSSHHVFRTGDDFYTMREYQIGDDLRRIHWPSVARRGRLMIRQDETARRSRAALFLDTRVVALGQTGQPGFEKAVSAAASIGALFTQSGFSLQLVTPDIRPTSLTEEHFMEALAGVGHARSTGLGTALVPLRAMGGPDISLVVVTAPLVPSEVAALSRVGAAFGPKLAVLVYPADPGSLHAEAQSKLEGKATAARLSLVRAGWEVLILSPTGKLEDLWRATKTKLPAVTGSWR
jgi:uncharacterized protein (DUF58 family)